MKKLVYRGTILTVFCALAVSCNKKEIQKVSESSAPQNLSVNSDNIRYVDALGNTISKNEVDMNSDAVLMVEWENNSNTQMIARYFINESSAYKYVSSQPTMAEAKKKMEFIKEVRELAEATGDIDKVNPDDFSDEVKLKLSSYVSSQNQEKGVGILYDNLNASGSISVLTGNPQPTLFSFNNKAESATGAGLANWLWDKKFFRGSSIYLLLGTGSVLNFDGLGFQNKAESGL